MSKTRLFPYTLPYDVIPPLWRSTGNGTPAPVYALGWYTTEERLQARFQEYEAQFIELYIVTKDWNKQTGDKFGKLVFDPRIMRQMDKIFCFFISNKRVDTLEVLKNGDIASIIQAGKQCLRITDDEDHTLKWYRFGPRD